MADFGEGTDAETEVTRKRAVGFMFLGSDIREKEPEVPQHVPARAVADDGEDSDSIL
jgi:hypothetical protein